ncbi:MAG: hypothetical protein HY303_09715 [Candidatus Wallbacteria bacterium]|nr:hypothetical protein [Candidatus Wallbacteria bacterium]
MRSLYWKICATFLVVVLVSLAAGMTTFNKVWWSLRRNGFHERSMHREATTAEGPSRERPAFGGRNGPGGRSGPAHPRGEHAFPVLASSLRSLVSVATREIRRQLDTGVEPSRLQLDGVLGEGSSASLAYVSGRGKCWPAVPRRAPRPPWRSSVATPRARTR